MADKKYSVSAIQPDGWPTPESKGVRCVFIFTDDEEIALLVKKNAMESPWNKDVRITEN